MNLLNFRLKILEFLVESNEINCKFVLKIFFYSRYYKYLLD